MRGDRVGLFIAGETVDDPVTIWLNENYRVNYSGGNAA
jgi:hypothetical protein